MKINFRSVQTTYTDPQEVVVPFGMYKGEKLKDIPASYVAFLALRTGGNSLAEQAAKEILPYLIDAGEVIIEVEPLPLTSETHIEQDDENNPFHDQ